LLLPVRTSSMSRKETRKALRYIPVPYLTSNSYHKDPKHSTGNSSLESINRNKITMEQTTIDMENPTPPRSPKDDDTTSVAETHKCDSGSVENNTDEETLSSSGGFRKSLLLAFLIATIGLAIGLGVGLSMKSSEKTSSLRTQEIENVPTAYDSSTSSSSDEAPQENGSLTEDSLPQEDPLDDSLPQEDPLDEDLESDAPVETKKPVFTVSPPIVGGGQQSWPELIGSLGVDAKAYLEVEYGDQYDIQLVAYGDGVTKDLRYDRIFLFLDQESYVMREPRVGRRLK
jgi:hypothetical protein